MKKKNGKKDYRLGYIYFFTLLVFGFSILSSARQNENIQENATDNQPILQGSNLFDSSGFMMDDPRGSRSDTSHTTISWMNREGSIGECTGKQTERASLPGLCARGGERSEPTYRDPNYNIFGRFC